MKNCFLILIIIAACSSPTNTWDPQVSASCKQSKEFGYFLAQYEENANALKSIIQEAWFEKCWKYKNNNGTISKTETKGCKHFVLKLTSERGKFDLEDYFKTWDMVTIPDYTPISRSGDRFYVYIPGDDLPGTFTVKLTKNDSQMNKQTITTLNFSRIKVSD